ncbi:MAG: hypothetical protein IK128_08055 [Clostridiales bacterium]|nr:hypothetical protein [Clostridiales bacterium]
MSISNLFGIVGSVLSVLVEVLLTAVFIYISVTIVLFIVDAIKAKSQGRKIRTGFKVMFIIAMILLALMIALAIYVILVLLNIFMFGPF